MGFRKSEEKSLARHLLEKGPGMFGCNEARGDVSIVVTVAEGRNHVQTWSSSVGVPVTLPDLASSGNLEALGGGGSRDQAILRAGGWEQ